MKFTTPAYTASLLIVGIGLAVNTNAQSFLTNGLVAYYPFNGNALDASGNQNSGVEYSITYDTDRHGIAGRSARFDSLNSSYIDIDGIRTNIGGLSQATFTFWLKCYSVQNWAVIFGDWASGYSGGIYFEFSNGQLEVFNDPSFGGIKTAQIIPTNSWLHVSIVFDGLQPQPTNYVRFFLNGYETASDTNANVHMPSTIGNGTSCFMGRRDIWPGYGRYFTGNLDDFRIYNRALSASEVQQLYAYESEPTIYLRKVVSPSFSNLYLGTNYQLQVSADMNTWTNQGTPFTPTNTTMIYPQYWDVDNWNQLYFRLEVVP
jgi:hypothetical protein